MGLLATQTFAQTATAAPSPNNDQAATTPAAVTLQTVAQAPDSLPSISTNNTAEDANALPEAPSAVESASLIAPVKTDLLLAVSAPEASSSTTSTSAEKKHKMRPGFLALGIVGGVAAGFGAYIFSIKTSNTSGRDALGTIFLASGAAAAGLGFYFAFK